jgi:L-2-hydroxyglutarate oxidase LhgO
MTKNIIIIGGGWYGCHIASILKEYNFNITIIEKNNTIFDNSSYYNQNRLHLGYHYCRNYSTRQLCKKSYYLFINKYNHLIDTIINNYYVISTVIFF